MVEGNLSANAPKKKDHFMIGKIVDYIRAARLLQTVSVALSRGAATSALRKIDLQNPTSWEFSAFSQNREDGIIDVLIQHLLHPDQRSVEVGASFGTENNTSWLGIAKKYRCLFVDVDKKALSRLRLLYSQLSIDAQVLQLRVDPANAHIILQHCAVIDPDVFSLDIDGNDYYVAESLFNAKFRPKIVIVEYNSAFGPDQSLTVRYRDESDFFRREENRLYYGVSVSGWRRFFSAYGYRFVTVESRGVNAFFVDPRQFDTRFLQKIKGLSFAENAHQSDVLKIAWQQQFASIRSRDFKTIEHRRRKKGSR